MKLRSFRELEIYVAVYEHRSFTIAAQTRNTTQSGVSQTIKLLEQALGVRLLFRDRKQVVPTPAGDRFYTACIAALRSGQMAEATVETFRHGMDGKMTVGLVPAITRCALAPAFLRFSQAHPNVSIRIMQGYSSELLRQLYAEAVDFAIVPALADTTPGLSVRPFITSPESLVTARQPGRQSGPIRLSELSDLKLLLPSPETPRRRKLDAYMALNKVSVAQIRAMDSLTGALSIVRDSDWATIFSTLVVSDKNDFADYTVQPIADPSLSLDLVVIELQRKRMAPPAENFLSFLFEEATRLNASWS